MDWGCLTLLLLFFFFNDTATTEIYTLSLHDALPISRSWPRSRGPRPRTGKPRPRRSEEHTSELQSRENLVCRLLLEKKQKNILNAIFLPKSSIHLKIQLRLEQK